MEPIMWRSAVAIFFVVSSALAVATDLAIGFRRSGEIATADQVTHAVGNVSYYVNCPRSENYKERTVIVGLEKPGAGWRELPVLKAILNSAIDTALERCPMSMSRVGGSMLRIDDVGEARIYARSTEGEPPALVARAENFVAVYRYWDRVVDVEADREKAAAAAAALKQAELERQAAATLQAQQAQAAAAQAQRISEFNARSRAESNQFWSNVWLGIKLLFWGGLATWIFSKREIIMRWYYLLTPHPAESMVEAAMHSGVNLDGKAFADIMRPMPGGRIEKEVRAQQARKLAEKAHRYAETMRAEAERIMAEAQRDTELIKAEAQQDTEFIKAQDELIKAAMAHKKAKASLDILRKRVE
ncbi:MAG: hypothetical protein ACLQHK_05415 [Gallionellaceae bacterium]